MSNERRELMKLIDDHRDRHGQPSEASIARAIGVATQTVNSWRSRGVRQPPERKTMERLAELLGLPFEDYVLQVVLYDCRLRNTMPEPPAHKREGRGLG